MRRKSMKERMNEESKKGDELKWNETKRMKWNEIHKQILYAIRKVLPIDSQVLVGVFLQCVCVRTSVPSSLSLCVILVLYARN